MKKVLIVTALVVLLLALAVSAAAAAVSSGDSLTRLLSPRLQGVTVSSVVSIGSVPTEAGAVYDSSTDGSNLASQTFHDPTHCHEHADAASSHSSPSY
jgi:hypothetical protein